MLVRMTSILHIWFSRIMISSQNEKPYNKIVIPFTRFIQYIAAISLIILLLSINAISFISKMVLPERQPTFLTTPSSVVFPSVNTNEKKIEQFAVSIDVARAANGMIILNRMLHRVMTIPAFILPAMCMNMELLSPRFYGRSPSGMTMVPALEPLTGPPL